MKNIVTKTAFITAVFLAGFASFAHAAAVPCEDSLKALRAAQETVKLSDADAKKVADLEAKGVERCNADDDKRADQFFSEAMKIMGK